MVVANGVPWTFPGKRATFGFTCHACLLVFLSAEASPAAAGLALRLGSLYATEKQLRAFPGQTVAVQVRPRRAT
jgi:hypothetical protein